MRGFHPSPSLPVKKQDQQARVETLHMLLLPTVFVYKIKNKNKSVVSVHAAQPKVLEKSGVKAHINDFQFKIIQSFLHT